jgi:superfamily II DNA or RNA helicase
MAAKLYRREPGTKFRDWFPAQLAVFALWEQAPNDRMCVYYPTGQGKTRIMLTSIYLRDYLGVVIVAPPSTHAKWIHDAKVLGLKAEVMSHAKFRMADTKLSRHTAIIVDEFHLLGGQKGQGWKKLDRLATGLQAPLIIGSATPNYNDAERVYCIAHVLNPLDNRGGYDAWLYQHCITEPNPFSRIPIVKGFRQYADAEHTLAAMPGVAYLPDEAPDILQPVPLPFDLSEEFDEYGLDERNSRIMASLMEKRHQNRLQQIIGEDGLLRPHVYDRLQQATESTDGPLLVFAAHSTVADALALTYDRDGVKYGYVNGKTSTRIKEERIEEFRRGKLDVLIGTATLATGTDGIDKVCDTMVILDDTDDDSLRRQLVGRILPRGESAPDYSKKVALQFIYKEN